MDDLIIEQYLINQRLKELAFKKFDPTNYCFQEQLAFIRDPATYKTAVCSRRAGKTIACVIDLLDTALRFRNVVCLYITLKRTNAKRIIWPELLRINSELGLGGKPNETDLSLKMPNGSVIYCSGAKDKSEIENFRGLALKKVYIDECFHPDTLVDTPYGPVRIADIKEGDIVNNALGVSRVTKVSVKKLDEHIRLGYGSKQVKCSMNHPFFTQRGWVNASELKIGDLLVTHDYSVRLLRDGDTEMAHARTSLASLLQSELCEKELLERPSLQRSNEEQNGKTRDHSGLHMLDVWEAGSGKEVWEASRSSFLRTQLRSELRTVKIRKDQKDDLGKPNVQSFDPDQNGKEFKEGGLEANEEMREWSRPYRSREGDYECDTFYQVESCDRDKGTEEYRVSSELQSRPSLCRYKACDRNRWTQSLFEKKIRPKERPEAQFIRLDSIEIFKQGSDERNPEGHFYDLEVEGHPSFSVNGVLVHNCQSFRSYLQELIDDVLSKALFDFNGTLCLIGTPGLVPAGYFYEASHSSQWSNHSWTMFQNPWLEIKSGKTVMELVTADCERMGVSIDDPKIQRENYGRWVVDPNARVFHYSDTKNNYEVLPDHKDQWEYIIGVDIGFDDSDAIAVIGWHPKLKETYLVYEEVKDKQGITELAESIDRLIKQYSPLKVVMDTGGLGKKIAEEIKKRFAIAVEPAEKSRKFEFIELLNDALRTRKFFAKKTSRFAQDSLLVEWDRDTKLDKPKISDAYHSDICDAVLYAFREALHWLYEPEVYKPKRGTAEYFEKEEKEMEEMAYDQAFPKEELDFFQEMP